MSLRSHDSVSVLVYSEAALVVTASSRKMDVVIPVIGVMGSFIASTEEGGPEAMGATG